MPTVKVHLDLETFDALRVDASRYVRPIDWHAQVLLRQSVGLPFPYPMEEVYEDMKKPASAANAAGRGAPTEREMLNDGTRG